MHADRVNSQIFSSIGKINIIFHQHHCYSLVKIHWSLASISDLKFTVFTMSYREIMIIHTYNTLQVRSYPAKANLAQMKIEWAVCWFFVTGIKTSVWTISVNNACGTNKHFFFLSICWNDYPLGLRSWPQWPTSCFWTWWCPPWSSWAAFPLRHSTTSSPNGSSGMSCAGLLVASTIWASTVQSSFLLFWPLTDTLQLCIPWTRHEWGIKDMPSSHVLQFGWSAVWRASGQWFSIKLSNIWTQLSVSSSLWM